MGRPLNDRLFGNRNTGGEGGESVASVTVAGTNNDYTAIPTLTFSAPTLPGGTTATGTVSTMSGATVAVNAGGTGYTNNDIVTVSGGTGTAITIDVGTVAGGVVQAGQPTIVNAGAYTVLPSVTGAAVTGGTGGDDATFDLTFAVDGVTVGDGGSGYVSVADAAITDSEAGNATFTPVLTTSNANAIQITAFVTGGSAKAGDIVAQTGSNRYRVTTADGTEEVYLTGVATGSLTAGQANITALDSAGGTYFVTKLTANHAIVTAGTGVQFSTGDKVVWTFDSPTLNETIQIPNA